MRADLLSYYNFELCFKATTTKILVQDDTNEIEIGISNSHK